LESCLQAHCNPQSALERIAGQKEVSGITYISDVNGANAAIASGRLDRKTAMGFITIVIAREELNHPKHGNATLHGLLIHEGTHAQIRADILTSLTSTDSKKHQNETWANDEFRARMAAATYFRFRGNNYADLGIDIKLLLNKPGLPLNEEALKKSLVNQYKGHKTVLEIMKEKGIKPKTP